MSVRIFFDVEEALSRLARRIISQQFRTLNLRVLQETYDPFTGEIVPLPINAKFYDSSADTANIVYPNFFIRLMKSREDRFSKREIAYDGSPKVWNNWPKTNHSYQKAYEIVVDGYDGTVPVVGSTLTTGIFNIIKVTPGLLLKLLNGNNIGTYTITSTIINGSNSTITVSNTLISALPTATFIECKRELVFLNTFDLSTAKVGDIFTDSMSNPFTITAIDYEKLILTIGGTTTPSTLTGGSISRTSNVFTTVDTAPVNFLVMDPNQPVMHGVDQAYTSKELVSPAVPLDLYYLMRVDSKERDTHIEILNRIWEEFNPPRAGLPVIIRSKVSAEVDLFKDIPAGGSNTIEVWDNSKFKINDKIFVFDDFTPTNNTTDGYELPFETQIVNLVSNNQIVVKDVVPDTFLTCKKAKIVSNAEYKIHMFHFVDHVTKDVEGSQYWSHELTFWVQVWVDRLEAPQEVEVIEQIQSTITDF